MPSEFATHWTLEPGITFLNHASFGATPRPVLEAQSAWRERMEREPVAFFSKDLEPLLDQARAVLADLIGADPADVVFVPNATTGINTVLRSLHLEGGDELLTTDHAYNAVKNAMERVAQAAGARVVIANVRFPGTDPQAVASTVMEAVTERTRLVVIDHVTSATALIFPIAELVSGLTSLGIDTLVDGAHAPGMVGIDVEEIGAAYYTANCHKWLCAPKGSGFLHVRRDRRAGVLPLVTSHGANSPRTDRSRFHLEHDWTGTFDPSAWLSVPAAIDFGASLLPGGWPALRERNRALALTARDLLCEALDEGPPAPDEMIGSMAAVALPVSETPVQVQGIALYGDPVHDALLHQHGIQVMVTPWPQRPDSGPWRRLLRVSVPAYVDRDDLERLSAAIRQVIGAPETSSVRTGRRD